MTNIYNFANGASLWQGSLPPQGWELRKKGFSTLVLSAADFQFEESEFPGVKVLYAPLNDSEPSYYEIRLVIATVHKIVRELSKGRAVLVTCAMGLNRSGFLVASTLLALTDLDPDKIVAQIRSRRGQLALSNSHFVKILKDPKYRKELLSRT